MRSCWRRHFVISGTTVCMLLLILWRACRATD